MRKKKKKKEVSQWTWKTGCTRARERQKQKLRREKVGERERERGGIAKGSVHPCIHVKIKGSLGAANTRSLNFLLHLPTYQPLIMRVTLRCSQVPSFKWPLFEATWPGIVSTQPSPCSTFLNGIIPRERVLHLTRRKLGKEASASVASRVTVVCPFWNEWISWTEPINFPFSWFLYDTAAL